MTVNSQGISFWRDENILKLDYSDGCTVLKTNFKKSLNWYT